MDILTGHIIRLLKNVNSLSVINSCHGCTIVTFICYKQQQHASPVLDANKTAGRQIYVHLWSFSQFVKISAHNILLTVGGNTAEVLLKLGHVKSGIQGFSVSLIIGECSGGEVRVRSVQADRARGDAAGYLQ